MQNAKADVRIFSVGKTLCIISESSSAENDDDDVVGWQIFSYIHRWVVEKCWKMSYLNICDM